MSEEKVILTAEQAKAMMADGDMVHTFRSAGRVLIGGDWSRDELEELIEAGAQCELGGEMCTRMKHGLVIWTPDKHGPLFVATKESL